MSYDNHWKPRWRPARDERLSNIVVRYPPATKRPKQRGTGTSVEDIVVQRQVRAAKRLRIVLRKSQ